MKKILGLDLGSTSIGWAFIEEAKESSVIKKLGVRVIPYSGDEKDQFSKGQAITKNKDRTLKRTTRKTNNRYKQRRSKLNFFLKENNMAPEAKQLLQFSATEIFGLRSKAISEQVTLQEIGRILYHLNQKRGYKSSRHTSEEDESGKKLSDYLAEIKERKDILEEKNFTIGEYFYSELLRNPFYTIKKNVFPRESYIAEFNRIWDTQANYYPTILTDKNKVYVRDEIIYFQRKLKSQKGLVGKCQFELNHRVTPRSSPLFQMGKIWESINNITLYNKHKETFTITLEQKKQIFKHLDSNEKLNQTDLFKILGVKRTEGWYPNEQIKKAGLQGNVTKVMLLKKFKEASIERPDLLQFNITQTKRESVNKQTGEIKVFDMVDASFENEPLYQLWHLLYSVDEPTELIAVLEKKLGLSTLQAEQLSKLDFKKMGFGNKSARAIRKLLPSLMQGNDYSKAANLVNYNHSHSITKQENENRELKNHLSLYARNTLRQPVVEKILNQLINIVNAICNDDTLGRPDEIRVELARELRKSQEERNKDYNRINKTDREHKDIKERLGKEFPGLPISRKTLEKYKLYVQQDGVCMYSGTKMELGKVLKGEGIDVDHIIPQSKLFDDSFQNKVLAYRKENENKSNATAFDYMKSKSEDDFLQFIERVNKQYNDEKITRSKQSKLLMTEADIPDDFISRQINETRYISKEATRLLKEICRNVYSTSGSVTDFLRNEWGYNKVLQELNWHKYEAAGQTKDGKIDGWSKRDDHRHHAIDALVVACTNASLINRLNKLNSGQTRQEMLDSIKGKTNEGWQAKKSLLEQYVQLLQPFNTKQVKEAVNNIIISVKAGKKVTSTSYNKADGKKTISPRGKLHKEQVYGKIKRYSQKKTPLNGRFKDWELIANPREKELVIARIQEADGDAKKAFKDLAKKPIWLDVAKTKALTEVTLWEECFVYKYTLDQNFKEKDIDSIIDVGIREKVRQRFLEKAGSKDHPLKNLANEPIWLNAARKIPILSVRCNTGLSGLVPLHISDNGLTKPVKFKTEKSKPIDYVSTRNNHHIAIYKTPEGALEEKTVTLWEAVERKKLGIPVIVDNPKQTWDDILNKGLDQQNLLANLPGQDWELVTSLQQNELFVFRMNIDEVDKALKNEDHGRLTNNLYKVQKMSKKSNGAIQIYFRHHLETSVDDKKGGGEILAKKLNKVIIIGSISFFANKAPIKVKINSIGQISII